MINLEVENVRVEYAGSSGPLTVLDGVTFQAKQGDVLAIVGPSGCGKTTLLHALAGLRTYGGSIKFAGTQERPKIGYAFQTPRLLNWLTIRENVALVTIDDGQQSVDANVQRSLQQFEAHAFADKYPLFCSEGEKARATLARALVNAPPLLLMDEPFAHLDMLTAEKIRQRLKDELSTRWCTVILVTHNLFEAVEMSDQIIVLTKKPARVAAILPGLRGSSSLEGISSCVQSLQQELGVPN